MGRSARATWWLAARVCLLPAAPSACCLCDWRAAAQPGTYAGNRERQRRVFAAFNRHTARRRFLTATVYFSRQPRLASAAANAAVAPLHSSVAAKFRGVAT